jgi:hypothetical protein
MASFIVRAAALAGAAAWCVPLTGWSQTTELLSISGVPPTTVQAGQTYSFTPQAEAEGPLIPSFQIQNLPPWASFNWSGQLMGTPAASDAGVYSNIVISLVAGDFSASLPAFSITVQAPSSTAGTATISWTPPTTNTDGSPLTDLAVYHIYAGAAPDRLTLKAVIGNSFTDLVIDGLSPGLYYFAMTAVNSQGAESELSTVVSATL